MVKLENKAYKTAAKGTFKDALVNLAIAIIALSLGAFWFTWDVIELVLGAVAGWVFYIVGLAIGIGIVWIFAQLFGGKGKYATHYNGGSYLALAAIPSIVPVVGQIVSGLLGLWGVVMHVFLVKEVHKLSTGRAVASVLLPYALLLLLVMIVVAIVGAAFLGYLTGMDAV